MQFPHIVSLFVAIWSFGINTSMLRIFSLVIQFADWYQWKFQHYYSKQGYELVQHFWNVCLEFSYFNSQCWTILFFSMSPRCSSHTRSILESDFDSFCWSFISIVRTFVLLYYFTCSASWWFPFGFWFPFCTIFISAAFSG